MIEEKIIELPIYGIVVKLRYVDDEYFKRKQYYMNGLIESNLYDKVEVTKSNDLRIKFIHDVILFQGMAGIDIESPAYLQSIENLVEKYL